MTRQQQGAALIAARLQNRRLKNAATWNQARAAAREATQAFTSPAQAAEPATLIAQPASKGRAMVEEEVCAPAQFAEAVATQPALVSEAGAEEAEDTLTKIREEAVTAAAKYFAARTAKELPTTRHFASAGRLLGMSRG